jgi:uncharacterized protein
MPLRHVGTEIIDRRHCLELLSGARVGRVGFSSGALPLILPVRFTVIDGDVLFCTGTGSKLEAAMRHQVACFEADEFDHDQRSGWSVLVSGPTEVVADPHLVAAAERAGLACWDHDCTGERVILLHSDFVSGRWLHSAAGEVAPGT